jgi:uncharacterized protein (DUF1684 family)
MTALQVADWRRRVHAIYASVRQCADPFAAHELWRRGRDELFATHPSTPLLPDDRAKFTGLPVRPYDPSWRFEVAVRIDRVAVDDVRTDAAYVEPRTFEFETGTDGIVPFELIGVADLPGIGSLDVWRLASYGGGIFIPVKDALHGTKGGTYGGGRYLLDTVKGADLGPGAELESLVLDFNFAYNPSCAYDPRWACPLAPAGNSVDVDIPAGERYSGAY